MWCYWLTKWFIMMIIRERQANKTWRLVSFSRAKTPLVFFSENIKICNCRYSSILSWLRFNSEELPFQIENSSMNSSLLRKKVITLLLKIHTPFRIHHAICNLPFHLQTFRKQHRVAKLISTQILLSSFLVSFTRLISHSYQMVPLRLLHMLAILPILCSDWLKCTRHEQSMQSYFYHSILLAWS